MQNPLASLRVPDKSPSCPRGGNNGGWKGSNQLREGAEHLHRIEKTQFIFFIIVIKGD